MSGTTSTQQKNKQDDRNGVAENEKPVSVFKMKTYKGVVMYDNEIEEIEKMDIREDDVWVCCFPRSGTTLTQEIVYLISTGDFDTAKSVELDDRFPVIDVKHDEYPFYRGLKHFEKMKSQRFVKTHFHYFLLPEQLRKGKGKMIYTTRNPKDSILSLYKLLLWFRQFDGVESPFKTFFDMFMKGEGTQYLKQPEIRFDLHSGIKSEANPDILKDGFKLSIRIIKRFMEIYTDGSKKVYAGPWWTHVRQYWDHRTDKNLLFLKYEDTIKDLPGTIRKIAKFLGKSLSEEVVSRIADHCSLENMRSNKMLNLDYQRKYRAIDDSLGGFINKGIVGGWKGVLTVEMSNQVDEMFQREFGDTDLTFE